MSGISRRSVRVIDLPEGLKVLDIFCHFTGQSLGDVVERTSWDVDLDIGSGNNVDDGSHGE